jgi:hypothetical protein
MSASEVIFAVEEGADGGYIARALGHSIFTQADSFEDLKKNVQEAVRCHFDDGERPRVVVLRFVREEVIAV